MKICLLGEYSGNSDEGMRKVSFHFAEELKKQQHQVLSLDLREVFSKAFWKDFKAFKPEIIHYVHGPSIKSFIVLKIVSVNGRGVKTVISAMHPCFTILSKRFIPFFKPDLILTQSKETEEMFKKRGCKTEFLPCGVDVKKFTPVTIRAKEELREKYGIDKEKFIILHIGSMKEGRNVQLLEKLQNENNQVVIVAATSTGIEKNLTKQLKKSGCLVWTRHFRDIEEVYALSDCYIFPVPPENRINSIEMPLSVLEAMSCNLPVITTKFGALPKVFKENAGLFFIENENVIFTALEGIKNGVMVKIREKVIPYSWENIGKKLEEIYIKLMDSEMND